MIVGNLAQTEKILEIDTNMIGYQWSENLQLKVTYDSTYVGWSKKWDAIGSSKKKRIPLAYNDTSKTITLSKVCFEDELLFISCAFIKDGVVVNTSLIRLYIAESVNHGLDTVPTKPGLYEEMRELFEQINENEYRKPMQELINNTNAQIKRILDKADGDYEAIKNDIDAVIAKYKIDYDKFVSDTTSKYELDRQAMVKEVSETLKKFNDEAQVAMEVVEDIHQKLANDEFRGEQGIQGIQGKTGNQGVKGDIGATGEQGIQGIQGIQGKTGMQGIQGLKGDTGATGIQGIQGIKGDKGDKGDTGAQGLSGISAPTSGMFSLVGDEVTGDLYAEYPDDTHPPGFDVDTSKNIYLVI